MALDGNLSARLKEQISRESETIQSATQQQLDVMQEGLKSIYADALSTIEADMRGQSRALAKRLRRLMLWPSLLLVMISVAISAGAWAWTQYQWGQIQERQQTLLELDTLGIEVVEQRGTKFVLMPSGATSHTLESGQIYIRMEN